METRVGWVVDELKKCNVLPEDVYVDSRLFAMRSADHVSSVFNYIRCFYQANFILAVSCFNYIPLIFYCAI